MIIPCLILILIIVIIVIILICIKKTEIFTVTKGLYLLKTVTVLLKKHNIKTWLDAGTLLGVIRDGELIEHDTDVDISTYYDSAEKLGKLAENKELLESKQLECWRNKENIVSLNFIGDSGTYIDIYIMKWKPKLQSIRFKNYIYNVPKDPESYLEILYGNWEIPQKGKHADPSVHLKGQGVKNDKKYFDENILRWEE